MKMNNIDNERKSDQTNGIISETQVSVIDLDKNVDNNAIKCEDNVLDASIIRIRFKDAATYSELNGTIARCVKNALFHFKKNVICTEDASMFTIRFNETNDDDNSLFIVDSAPCETPELTNIIPEYRRSEVIIDDKNHEAIKDETVPIAKAAANTCFNCDGDHSIKDCTKPKDLAKIRQNRTKFSSNRVNFERYHVDVEQRFGHLVAGELSNDLRNALGLRSKELPMHIYRMRMLGYPPGWLEHAKVSGSGLTLFDSEGKGTVTIEKDDEDKIDLKKIISFPGFNVDPPYGTRDESRAYRAPPMQPQQSKACMVEYFRSKSTKAYKKKVPQNVEVPILEPTDMDIDDESDDDDQLGERLDQSKEFIKSISSTPLPLTNSSSLSDGEIIENEPTRDSPSLDDLNERKKRLLVALDDSTLSITTLVERPSEDDSLIDDIMALDSSEINDENVDTSKADTNSSSADSQPGTPQVNLRVSKKGLLHTSKETVCGTPVIKGVSSFSNLPNSRNWREGVSDVIDFENLPESTGTYDKMRTLIVKVREKVRKIQYEDENEDR